MPEANSSLSRLVQVVEEGQEREIIIARNGARWRRWCPSTWRRRSAASGLRRAASRSVTVEPNASIWVSAASLWEISTKHGLGRGDMPVSGRDALTFFKDAGDRILPITANHTVAVADLPSHHQDPFDRMRVAQARVEPMHQLTHDARVGRYDGSIVLV